MRKSIATVCLSGTLEAKLAAASEAGFDGVELFENDLLGCPLPPPEIARRARDLGLSLDLYQPFRDFEAVHADRFEENLRRAEHKLTLMEQLGTPTLLVCSNVSSETVDDDALAAHQLNELAERAAAHGVRVAYEALAWGRRVSEYTHSWDIVAAADHPHLGVCLDSFHILSRGTRLDRIRDIPGEKVFFLQLADAPRMVMDVMQWSRHYRCFPGQGSFDLTTFLADVLDTGYAGPLSLEVFNDVFRQADPANMAADGMRSLLALEESLSQRLGQRSRSSAVSGLSAVDLFQPPSPVDPSGLAFVEVAVDAESVSRTGAALDALGFTRSAVHRTKPVQLWQQGEARVLVNSGDERIASRPAGDAVLTTIALETSDSHRAAERARALLAPILMRRRGPNEVELPSVAAPDGTSVFLCCTDPGSAGSWLQDFLPVEGTSSATPVGLRGVDHVAMAQRLDQFDEAALFYQSVFGLQPRDSVDLSAPFGQIRSRAMSSPSGNVRVVLNVSQVGDIGLTSSSGAQHIALSCADIFAAARAVTANGAALLLIPGNYYDDLAARWDLDTDLLQSLRQYGVLYERTEAGEYYQFYTQTLGRGLFFEVVQRVGDYAGYGATNAPIRLAAQTTQATTDESVQLSPAAARSR